MPLCSFVCINYIDVISGKHFFKCIIIIIMVLGIKGVIVIVVSGIQENKRFSAVFRLLQPSLIWDIRDT